MCNFKTLHQSNNGYVTQCSRCNHIRIVFGNFCITQSKEGLQTMASDIGKFYETKQSEEKNKNIYLRTPAKNIMLVLTINELEELNNLLQQASLLLEANNILYADKNFS